MHYRESGQLVQAAEAAKLYSEETLASPVSSLRLHGQRAPLLPFEPPPTVAAMGLSPLRIRLGEVKGGVGEPGGEVLEGAAFVVQPVPDLFSRQGREQ
jgi:hypothetical protein